MLFATSYLDLNAQTPTPVQVSIQQMASGLSQPVGVYDCNDGRMFVLEKDAADIEILDANWQPVGKFLDLTGIVSTGGERGLLGMAFHPDYQNNGYFYVNYTNSAGDTQVSRYTVSGNPNVADPNSALPLLTIDQPYGNHNGGHIVFGPDGYLYIGMGDGGSGNDPLNSGQTPTTLLGKMLRIDVDNPQNGENYGIPNDNPFVGAQDTLPEIWALGLRNPWKFSFDSQTGELWIGDVGQNAWEELNLVPAGVGGQNYGWRCYEANHVNPNVAPCNDLDPATLTFPIYEFDQDVYQFCSITAGVRYRGTEYPGLQEHFVFADYCNGRLYSLYQDQNGNWDDMIIRNSPTFGIVMFYENDLGQVFYAHINNGAIYKITENCGAYDPYASSNGDGSMSAFANNGFTATSYWWYKDGIIINGATSATYTPDSSGEYYCVVANSANCSRQTNSLSWFVTGGVPGCTYANADNYNADAEVDDGSCTFSIPVTCPEDVDGNGVVNSGDLLTLLAAYGTSC